MSQSNSLNNIHAIKLGWSFLNAIDILPTIDLRLTTINMRPRCLGQDLQGTNTLMDGTHPDCVMPCRTSMYTGMSQDVVDA